MKWERFNQLKEISEVLAEFPKIHFHVDAVQAIGKVNYSEWLTDRVDFATFSAHKFHGPRGIGFMYWKQGKRLAPLLTGGGQETTNAVGQKTYQQLWQWPKRCVCI